jgi:hypothetical protein
MQKRSEIISGTCGCYKSNKKQYIWESACRRLFALSIIAVNPPAVAKIWNQPKDPFMADWTGFASCADHAAHSVPGLAHCMLQVFAYVLALLTTLNSASKKPPAWGGFLDGGLDGVRTRDLPRDRRTF